MTFETEFFRSAGRWLPLLVTGAMSLGCAEAGDDAMVAAGSSDGAQSESEAEPEPDGGEVATESGHPNDDTDGDESGDRDGGETDDGDTGDGPPDSTAGSESGAPDDPEVSVHGRATFVQLNASHGGQSFDGLSVDIDFRGDDDIVYGEADTPDDACTIWIQDVADHSVADQGAVTISSSNVKGAEGDPCEYGPGGYRLLAGFGELEAGVAIAPAADGQMLLGPAGPWAQEQWTNLDLELDGFVDAHNNGRFPVVQHAFTQFANLYNPHAVSEVAQAPLHYAMYLGRNPAPSFANAWQDVDAMHVGKDEGPDTSSVSAWVSPLGRGFSLAPGSDLLLDGADGSRTYACDLHCGQGPTETRWIYEVYVTDRSIALSSGLLPPESQFAVMECRGAEGAAALAVPATAREALAAATDAWPDAQTEVRLSRVHEVADGSTLVRAGYGMSTWQ